MGRLLVDHLTRTLEDVPVAVDFGGGGPGVALGDDERISLLCCRG
jgi:hypothetical protein